MRRRLPLLAVAGLLLLQASPLTAAPPDASLTIQADTVDVHLDDETTHAFGKARLVYGGLELCAEDITADRVTGDVVARGDLRLIQGERVMLGESVTYNLNSGVGELRGARVVEQGAIITGEMIEVSPRQAVARNAQFTTCDRTDPHFALAAERITLTVAETPSGEPPRSGQLSLSKGRLLYHGRSVLPIPGYTVDVGDVGRGKGGPAPALGFSGDDGPYLSMGYALGSPGRPLKGDFNYRYTTSRGIRGHLRAWWIEGPMQLTVGYYRRHDPADRPIEADDLEASLADVLVNREPEYGVVLPAWRMGRWFTLHGSWLAGTYAEYEPQGIEERMKADRSSLVLLARSEAYQVSPSLRVSHAVGWRQSNYRPGETLTARLLRTTADVRVNPRLELGLSHVSRRHSGESPFLFDGVGPSRELIGELAWTVNAAWRTRLVEYYDLENNEIRDMILEATRTAHCLEYTVGWRSERGMLYVGFGLARPPAQEQWR